MSNARAVCRKTLLLTGLVLGLLFAATGVAQAENFGELEHFGLPGGSPGELTASTREGTSIAFKPFHVIGVDPTTNDVYVLEEDKQPEENEKFELTRFLRLQEFDPSKAGELLGHTDFTYTSPPAENALGTNGIEGIAVDPAKERLYFLVTEQRKELGPGEEPGPENEDAAAASLYAFKTKPNAGKELEPAAGTSAGGVLAGEAKLQPLSETPGTSLLQPHGITVDPFTHEVIIVGHVDDCKTECEEDELAEHPLDHYAAQRITETGELGERFIDTKNALKNNSETSPLAPDSPVEVGAESAERLLANDLIEPKSTQEDALDEFPAKASGTPSQTIVPDTAGGTAEGYDEIEEGNEDIGGSLVSPDGKTLYGFTEIRNEEVAEHPRDDFGISERSAETLAPIGWTGGQRADAEDKCVLQPGIDDGEHLQLAVGGGGDIFVLVPEYLREPTEGHFPSKNAIIEFGPGGDGCPKAAAEHIVVSVGGKEVTGTVPTGKPATLSTFVKQGDALSVLWKIENESTKALVTEEQKTDQLQNPALVHTFTTAGSYKISEEIKTDNLNTPSLTVTRSGLAVGEGEAIKVTTQPKSQEVASGTAVKFTVAASGKPTPSPKWFVSSDGGAKFVEDEKAATGDVGTNTDTLEVVTTKGRSGYEYYAEFTATGLSPVKTEVATLTLVGGPKVTTQPENKTVAAGKSVSFTAAASGTPKPTVQWEVSSNGGASWAPVGGATSETLTIASTTAGENGDEFRAVFTSELGIGASSPAKLTVSAGEEAPVVTEQPKSISVLTGEPAAFTAAATGAPTPTVQWEVSSNGGASWAPVGGATSDTLTIAATTLAESGHEFRAVFTNKAGSKDSSPATLTVAEAKAPAITEQPVSVSVPAGKPAAFTAAASGVPTPTVQWEVSSNGGSSWAPVSGATSDTLTIAATTLAESGHEFRAVFTNKVGSKDSSPATLTVEEATEAPTVTEQPKNSAVLTGEAATFKAAATGAPTPTVQWEVSSNGGSSWTPVGGATSDTLTIAATTLAESGHEFRAVFTNKAGSKDSSPATLTVEEAKAPTITEQPTSASVLEGAAAAFKATATGAPAPTVQWEVSSNGGSSWAPVSGATSAMLTIAATTLAESGHEFRAVFTNKVGSKDSGPATLTVSPRPASPPPASPPPAPPTTTLPVTPAPGGGVGGFVAVAPRATIAGAASVTVSASGVLSLKLSCPAGATTCIGTVTLRTLSAVSARAHAAKSKKAILTLATASFSVAGGAAKTLTLHLSASARKLLAHAHLISARATISAHDTAGEQQTTTKVLTLHPAKPKRKH